jgi:integration host factor subunit alpha
MPTTKATLADSIFNHSDLQKKESIVILESLLEIIKHTLESGEDVLISGFGKFCVKDKNKRRGRNPDTGGDMTLRARRIVVFQCSGVLRERADGKG